MSVSNGKLTTRNGEMGYFSCGLCEKNELAWKYFFASITRVSSICHVKQMSPSAATSCIRWTQDEYCPSMCPGKVNGYFSFHSSTSSSWALWWCRILPARPSATNACVWRGRWPTTKLKSPSCSRARACLRRSLNRPNTSSSVAGNLLWPIWPLKVQEPYHCDVTLAVKPDKPTFSFVWTP